MACAQIKGIVMIQLDLAYAMKDLRGTFVKVKKNQSNIECNTCVKKINYHTFDKIFHMSTTYRCILSWQPTKMQWQWLL